MAGKKRKAKAKKKAPTVKVKAHKRKRAKSLPPRDGKGRFKRKGRQGSLFGG